MCTSHGRSSAPFPGKFAGASLKRCRCQLAGLCVRRAFPGKFAGASLKLRPAAYREAAGYIIPRQICRGLIEARPIGCSAKCRYRSFPGKFAGASLKLRRGGEARRGGWVIPRQICRGLIEATCRSALTRSVSRIPRQICRGLIEAQRAEPRSRKIRAAFPGKFAGASLKRCVEST